MPEPAFTYTGVAAPASPTLPGAILLQWGLHLRRATALRASWPYLLLAVAVVAGSLGLVQLALAQRAAIQEYFSVFVLRACALAALGMATSALRGDADSGALALHLLRPRAAVALPLGRWAAVVILVASLGLLMLGGMLLATAGTVLAPSWAAVARMAAAVVLAAMAYTSIFLAISAHFKAAAGMGLLYLVAGDVVAPSLPGPVGIVSVQAHLARWLPAAADEAWSARGVESLTAVAALLALAAAGVAVTVWRRGQV
ncbi:MAG: hypothetical protein ACOYOB_09330 [Myxococcota bacterium]